MVLIFIENV